MKREPTGPASRRLADLIKAQLKRLGWGPSRAATEAGLPEDAFRALFRGHRPNIDRAHDLCKAVGIELTIGVETRTNGPEPGTEGGTADTGNTRSSHKR